MPVKRNEAKDPKTLIYAKAVYKRMLEESDEENVWSGFTTELVASIDEIPNGYYSTILKALKQMGCITQVRRGGGYPAVPSKWQLLKEPTLKDHEFLTEGRLGPSAFELAQRVVDINHRLGELAGQIVRLERLLNIHIEKGHKEDD